MGKSDTIEMKQDAAGVFVPDGVVGGTGLVPPNPPEVPLSTPTVNYNEVPQVKSCSSNQCKNGHEWQPILQIARCPGCGSPLLAVKMLNCPICNEPCEGVKLRMDHLPQGGAIMPMCRGSQSLAEVQVVEIKLNAAAHEEATHTEREMISKP